MITPLGFISAERGVKGFFPSPAPLSSEMKRKTQKERILDLLKKRGEHGAKVYEFMTPRPQGCGVAQYNARIYELRREGYEIVNKEPGHFVLKQYDYEDNGQGVFA